ncbi:hypothetical protein [Desulfoscipio geothermicus]|uniref:DUF5320 domain-containing protein n=1 Tax=Desulfoscipio geothermicus DSM 3669 TaxID=1121426 RepID=A0A1I6D2E6_9FIRM|nr:hypothetical protein [Desulfoscipio geothermicus]SFQ99522.1 hypothetical protein SAMN05660706_104119 [Desulfoscipio geothermicus DSM 3669]
MCHGNKHHFNRCHGGPQQINTCHQGPHQHMNRCHGGSHHQPVRHEGCCCSSDGFKRQFFGKEEQAVKLEKYLQDLKLEAKAVEEKIKELKGEA